MWVLSEYLELGVILNNIFVPNGQENIRFLSGLSVYSQGLLKETLICFSNMLSQKKK